MSPIGHAEKAVVATTARPDGPEPDTAWLNGHSVSLESVKAVVLLGRESEVYHGDMVSMVAKSEFLVDGALTFIIDQSGAFSSPDGLAEEEMKEYASLFEYAWSAYWLLDGQRREIPVGTFVHATPDPLKPWLIQVQTGLLESSEVKVVVDVNPVRDGGAAGEAPAPVTSAWRSQEAAPFRYELLTILRDGFWELHEDEILALAPGDVPPREQKEEILKGLLTEEVETFLDEEVDHRAGKISQIINLHLLELVKTKLKDHFDQGLETGKQEVLKRVSKEYRSKFRPRHPVPKAPPVIALPAGPSYIDEVADRYEAVIELAREVKNKEIKGRGKRGEDEVIWCFRLPANSGAAVKLSLRLKDGQEGKTEVDIKDLRGATRTKKIYFTTSEDKHPVAYTELACEEDEVASLTLNLEEAGSGGLLDFHLQFRDID